jgi:hypothetical protein
MREPRPIKRVELSEQNKKLRLIAAIALFVIGVFGITFGITRALNQDTGWQRVQVEPQERNCSDQFVLQYNFSGTGAQATALHKQISAVYAEALAKTHQVFKSEEAASGNLADVNTHINQEITVDSLLYQAFEKLQNTRYHYLAPVYAHYDNVIFSTSDEYLEDVDPRINAQAREYVAQIADFAADPDAVSLELLGNNRVKLHVSDEYMAFARENEITKFIDLHYMANAFIIDYLADTMVQNGFTKGFLVSTDGYTRNLDKDQDYSMNLYDRVGDTVYPAGVLQYRGPVSMVLLKDFPVNPTDAFYRQSGDHVVFPYADPVDGMYKASVSNLLSYSYELGCADVLLKMLPGFAAEEFVLPQGVFSIWCEDRTICYNDEYAQISQLLDRNGVVYTAQKK